MAAANHAGNTQLLRDTFFFLKYLKAKGETETETEACSQTLECTRSEAERKHHQLY